MERRLLLIVSLWINGKDIAAFEAFERKAAAIMLHYGGRIEKVLRCSDADLTSGSPFEIHLVSFPDDHAFQAYRDDEQTRELGSLRQAVIERTEIWRGEEIAPYGAHATTE